MFHRFENRRQAGRKLAEKLERYTSGRNAVVLALPRGGVPVAYEIARALGAPLDVEVVRKLGVPGQRELAFGAIGPGGVAVFNERLLDKLHLSEEALSSVIESETAELKRREQKYRGARTAADLRGKTVIIVDDGLATGATMRAAVESVRRQAPATIIVAAPVASPEVCAAFESEPDVTCICAATPEPLYGVGWWYEDFEQTTDETVCRLLEEFQPVVAANGT
jgi:predicted phosphoribosyltransferase